MKYWKNDLEWVMKMATGYCANVVLPHIQAYDKCTGPVHSHMGKGGRRRRRWGAGILNDSFEAECSGDGLGVYLNPFVADHATCALFRR